MGCIKKFCSNCSAETIHNESGKKENGPRCTKCAQPYGTGLKRERNELLAKIAIRRFK